MVELRHLRHLLVLAEHGNFSRAAEVLHLTQPALTRSIQALEAQVGAVLFERRRGHIEATEMGRLLLRHAKAFQTSALDLEHEIRLAKGLELGELRIGVGPYGGAALIGPVVGRLNQRYPQLRVQLVVAPWQELPERARARDVDLVVAELSEIERLEDFALERLSAHETVTVCRPGHPMLGLERPSLAELFAYPLAGPRLPPGVAEALIKAAPAAQRERLQRLGLLTLQCDSSSLLKSIVQESDALSTMPRFMVQAELSLGRLCALPSLLPELRPRFGAAWLQQRSLSGAALQFVELLRSHDAALSQAGAQAKQVKRRAAAKRAAQS
ncbi:LysR family transcriptional regulator [Paucibacter sp. KBW04]|uniref:LysR family transcriptional regulator n=1 Tax=Paucibacter sp. KBW04 TaxID=2153361 RepID=UPI000F56E7A6|nr:LysR family transcriptional regulator [Paucibacter sp. KBW04]RQO59808.1 LysR family transcriptional regulator [Paucibacter sp. KBW04]